MFNPSGFQGAVTSVASSGNFGAGLAPLGLGALGLSGVLGGKGTRPKALHTEYAAEEANWDKPYGMGTDIVFYLQRADQTSSISDTTNNFGGDLSKGDQGSFNGQANSLTTGALPTNVGGVEPSRIPANVQAGPNGLQKFVQSPMGQIASAVAAGAAVGATQRFASNNTYTKALAGSIPTAVGYLTNFNKNESTQGVGVFTGDSATRQSLGSNARSAVDAAASAQGQFTASYPTGSKYWSNITNSAFNSDGSSPFEVPTTEFSEELSQASGGVNSSQFYRDLATKGDLGFTSPNSFSSTAVDFGDAISGGLALGSIGSFGGLGSSQSDIPAEWYFITAPQDINWSKDSEAKELNTYGSNNSYLSYGTTKLRKLTLSQALVEGFSDGKAVEDNVLQLEKCMKMVLNAGSGFTSPYCWHVYAGGKSYGVYLITSIKVKEQMRDMSGHATRAIVDIELQEVPSYQVSSGVDLTSKALTAVTGEAFNALKSKAIGNAGRQDSRASRAASEGY